MASGSSLSGLTRLPAYATATALLPVRLAERMVVGTRAPVLPAFVEHLGPAAVKFCQLLSTRTDLLPPRVCSALRPLHGNLRPLSPQVAQRVFRAQFGETGRVFAEIDWNAFAAGSIGCAHRASLKDGTPVVAKVLRPGVRTMLRRDLANLRVLARGIQRLPVMRGMPVADVVDRVATVIELQADFQREAAFLHALRENLRHIDGVHVPRPLPGLCGAHVLVMDAVANVVPVEAVPPQARSRLAHGIFLAMYEMLFVDGLVHCDLHPGNLLFTSEGRVCVVDAGFCVELPPTIRDGFADFFLAMSQGDGAGCARVFTRHALMLPDVAGSARFTDELSRLVEETAGLPNGSFSLGSFCTKLFALQRRHGVHADSDFVFPLVGLLQIEDVVRRLDPDVDFQPLAASVVRRARLRHDPIGKRTPMQKWQHHLDMARRLSRHDRGGTGTGSAER